MTEVPLWNARALVRFRCRIRREEKPNQQPLAAPTHVFACEKNTRGIASDTKKSVARATSFPMRNVVCADAGAYLAEQSVFANASFVTSLPDISELRGQSLEAWRAWFVDTVQLVASKCAPDGVSIFYQTDVFRNGGWIDKSYLCHQGAERAGARLLWHKIVCRIPAGTVADGRPGYAHMLCYSRELRMTGAFTADVIPELGSMDWSKAMGRSACAAACEWIRDNTQTRTIVDPFCGTGTVLAVANALGLEAVGVEIDTARAERARRKK